jgi:hypothetical protein
VKSTTRSLILLAAIAAPAVMPADLSAQHRAVPRPAVRHAGYGGYARPYYYGGYYRPYYGYYRPYYYGPAFGLSVGFGWYGSVGWYGAFGYPYYGYPYGYGYPYPAAYPYPGYYWDYGGSARIQIQPRHAEVFIDGHFVGLVDDFDGWAQRLNVAPGEHELTVYLKGYQTYRENVLFRPGATLRLAHVLQPLAPGQPEDARPVPARTRTPSRPSRDEYPAEDVQRRPGEPVPSPRRGAESGEYGSLSVRVQPLDAEVIVDGEPWKSPEAGSITLQLSEGTHKVEVRKDGYRTYAAEVRVRRGDTTSLNVSLTREQGINLVAGRVRKTD